MITGYVVTDHQGFVLNRNPESKRVRCREGAKLNAGSTGIEFGEKIDEAVLFGLKDGANARHMWSLRVGCNVFQIQADDAMPLQSFKKRARDPVLYQTQTASVIEKIHPDHFLPTLAMSIYQTCRMMAGARPDFPAVLPFDFLQNFDSSALCILPSMNNIVLNFRQSVSEINSERAVELLQDQLQRLRKNIVSDPSFQTGLLFNPQAPEYLKPGEEVRVYPRRVAEEHKQTVLDFFSDSPVRVERMDLDTGKVFLRNAANRPLSVAFYYLGKVNEATNGPQNVSSWGHKSRFEHGGFSKRFAKNGQRMHVKA